MSEFRLLTQTQLDELRERAQEELFPYCVGFVRVDATPEREPVLVGSGTLAVIDGTYGILTADHVLANLPTKGELGLVFGGPTSALPHQFTIDCGLAPRIRVAKASGDAHGPDLAFLALPVDSVSALKARASFYEITKRRERIFTAAPPIEAGGWILLGLIDEWTTSGPGATGFKNTRHFMTVCGGSDVSHEEQRDGFDYLYFEVKHGNAEENRPYSFAGASGGSLWQLVVRLEGARVTIKESLLSGVPFYQSPGRDGGSTVVCHGRSSIYDSVVQAVRRA